MFFHKDLLLQYFVAGTKVEGEDFELFFGDTEFRPSTSTENKIQDTAAARQERRKTERRRKK